MLFRYVSKVVCVLASLSFIGAHTGYANALTSTSATTIVVEQQEGLHADGAGSYRLHATAEIPPAAAAFEQSTSFQRYGFLLSSPQVFEQAAFAYQVDYTAQVPEGTELRVDARVSEDGVKWSSWEVDVANGALVDATMLATQVQYRVTFFGSEKISPVLESVSITPVEGAGNYTAMNTQTTREIAPTYRVHATRMGMVGGRTANGHIIKPRDHYVSLPSWRSLSSKGGREYLVRITYNGRTSVAPVWDVGPWNTRDNFWDVEREHWKDLQRGWPQDHAAYFENYNGRRASKGYVRFPTAVDVGDGVWWDDLGIRGDRAIVEITFLWLGEDPLAVTPTPSEVATAEATHEPSNDPAETAETATLEATGAPSDADPTASVEISPQPTGSAETSEAPSETSSPSESPSATVAPSEATEALPTSTVAAPTASVPAQTAEPTVAQTQVEPTELPPTATQATVEATASATPAPPTATQATVEATASATQAPPSATSAPVTPTAPAATAVPSASATAELPIVSPTTSVTTTATITATAVLTPTLETTAPSPTATATVETNSSAPGDLGITEAHAQRDEAYPWYAFWRRETWILP
jgi:hypothetical protein